MYKHSKTMLSTGSMDLAIELIGETEFVMKIHSIYVTLPNISSIFDGTHSFLTEVSNAIFTILGSIEERNRKSLLSN